MMARIVLTSIIPIFVTLFLSIPNAHAEVGSTGSGAMGLLESVVAHYQNSHGYNDNGVVVTTSVRNGVVTSQSRMQFETSLSKEGVADIQWTENIAFLDNKASVFQMDSCGVRVVDGSGGVKLYPDLRSGLMAMAGASRSISYVIPRLFFPDLASGFIDGIKNAEFAGNTVRDNQDLVKIRVIFNSGGQEYIWVDAPRLLIKMIKRTMQYGDTAISDEIYYNEASTESLGDAVRQSKPATNCP